MSRRSRTSVEEEGDRNSPNASDIEKTGSSEKPVQENIENVATTTTTTTASDGEAQPEAKVNIRLCRKPLPTKKKKKENQPVADPLLSTTTF